MTEADYLTILDWMARNTVAGKRSTVVTKRPAYFDLNTLGTVHPGASVTKNWREAFRKTRELATFATDDTQ